MRMTTAEATTGGHNAVSRTAPAHLGHRRSRRRRPGIAGSDLRARLGLVVDLDEALVVVGDLLGRLGALDALVEVALERVPPDRAADGEPDEALHRRGGAQPLVDLVVARSTAEEHADDAL